MAPRVGLFATCLVDLMRPSVGFAAVSLLEQAGCEVVVPVQTCCGQPSYNSGDRASARAIARQTIAAFEACDVVVVPSGSCAAMLALHYPALLRGEGGDDAAAAERFCKKVFELSRYLVAERGFRPVGVTWPETAYFHDGCSGKRELGLGAEARALLSLVAGLTLHEPGDGESCCGFGGLFSVKYPEVSGAIVDKKVADVEASGAGLVVGGDLGCLLNIAGRLARRGLTCEVRHYAEVLAGDRMTPPIGHSQGGAS